MVWRQEQELRRVYREMEALCTKCLMAGGQARAPESVQPYPKP